MESINAVKASSSAAAVKRSGSPVNSRLSRKKRRQAKHDAKTKTRATFASLPVEMVMNIFSNLGHSDLKNARRVCQNWNSAITSRPLLRKLSYTVQPGPTSLKTLYYSTVPWEDVRINNCAMPKNEIWIFSAILRTSLTSLTISRCAFPWSWLIVLLEQCKALKTLTLQMCRLVEDDDMISSGFVPANRPLLVKLEVGGYATSCLFLKNLINSTHFSQASVEISIPNIARTEDFFSQKLCLKKEEEAVVEMSKLVSACKLIRPVRVTVCLTSGNVSLDGCSIEDENGQKLIQMEKDSTQRLDNCINNFKSHKASSEYKTLKDVSLCIKYLHQFK